VSKKTRPRRSGASSKAPSGKAPSGKAPSGKAPSGKASSDGLAPGEADAIVREVLSQLWSAVASGDPFRAELEAASCMAIPLVGGHRDAIDETEKFISDVLVDGAVRRRTSDGAALLRLLMALGSPGTRKTASRALAELTGDGIYPPDWVTEVGKAVPGQAWRRYDVFGDDEVVAATFSYGDTEHGVVVQVDRAIVPTVTSVGVATDAASFIENISREDDEFVRPEQISLADARRRMEEPLARCEQDTSTRLAADTVAYLPVARTRIRRLPAEEAQPGPEFTAADRAAAVDDFMKSPQAADAVAADEDSTRFWAEALTGYSSRIPGEAPGLVGPRKLPYMLLGHVPNSFAISPAQRQHLEPAVTAWTRWSAAQRDLNEAETARLLEVLPSGFSRFDEAYADPNAVAIREYVSDLSTSDADIAWLSRSLGRRMFTLPKPGPGVATPADRRALVEAEFGTCTAPQGMTKAQFVDAVSGVIEELWHDDSNTTFRLATQMVGEGLSRHDLLHRLAGMPAPTRGSAIINEGSADRPISS
jgi:hypothetical protein